MSRAIGVVDPTVQVGIDALPECYSWELDECINPSEVARPELTPLPRCAAIAAAYAANEEAMELAVQKMPLCAHDEAADAYLAEPKTNWLMLGATGVLSLALGFFIGRMV